MKGLRHYRTSDSINDFMVNAIASMHSSTPTCLRMWSCSWMAWIFWAGPNERAGAPPRGSAYLMPNQVAQSCFLRISEVFQTSGMGKTFSMTASTTGPSLSRSSWVPARSPGTTRSSPSGWKTAWHPDALDRCRPKDP